MTPTNNSIHNAKGVWARTFFRVLGLGLLSIGAFGSAIFGFLSIGSTTTSLLSAFGLDAAIGGVALSSVIALGTTTISKIKVRRLSDADLMQKFSENVRNSCTTREDFTTERERKIQIRKANREAYKNLKYANEIAKRIGKTHRKITALENKRKKVNEKKLSKIDNQLKLVNDRNQKLKNCICNQMLNEAKSLRSAGVDISFYKNGFVKEIQKGNMFATNLARVAKSLFESGCLKNNMTSPTDRQIAEFVYDFHVLQGEPSPSNILFRKAIEFDKLHPITSSYTQVHYDIDFRNEMNKGTDAFGEGIFNLEEYDGPPVEIINGAENGV